jgi:hypothetical protein
VGTGSQRSKVISVDTTEVRDIEFISSELGAEKLERKLMLKIKEFNFANAKVLQITVSYPIDFLPL